MNARTVSVMIMTGVAIGLAPRAYAAGWPGGTAKCPLDAVKVGATCVDKYEASVWQIPAATLGTRLSRRIFLARDVHHIGKRLLLRSCAARG